MVRIVLLRVLESFFRHRWLYLLPAVLFLAAGIAIAFLSPIQYESSGIISVQSESYLSELTSVRDSSFSWQTPANVTTSQINELLGTNAFIRSMIQQTDLEEKMDDGESVVDETIEDVRDSFSVSALGTNHLEITARHEQRMIAYQLASAAVDRFIEWQISTDRGQSMAAQGFFNELIESYRLDVDNARAELEAYLTAHPEPVRGERPIEEVLEIERLEENLNLAQTRYANALDKQENADLATAQVESDVRQRFVVIDAPKVMIDAGLVTPTLIRQIGIFAVLGVFVSIALIALSAFLDRTIRYPLEVQHLLHLDVLSQVPSATIAGDEPVDVPVDEPASAMAWEGESETTTQPTAAV